MEEVVQAGGGGGNSEGVRGGFEGEQLHVLPRQGELEKFEHIVLLNFLN